jgi:hypothetical protein
LAVWVAAAAILLASFLVFAAGVPSEPVFVDETAYVVQSYFYDLLLSGKRDDWAWIEYHAYDLPPLPKYLIGFTVESAGYRPPDRTLAGRWFLEITRPLVPDAMILEARWPSVALGALGCLGLFALGAAAGDRRLGLLSAALLALNPLYTLMSRRAMADIPAECFLLLTLALALHAWRQTLVGCPAWISAALWTVAGVLLGLAVLSKLTGLLAEFVLVAWAALTLALTRFPLVRRLAVGLGVSLASACALATFVALNPMVTAHPTGTPPPLLLTPLPPDQSPVDRLHAMIRHRIDVSAIAQERFPHNAVATPLDKLLAAAVQGFGRFGALGPRDHRSSEPYPRFALERDWGALLWLPLAVAGGVVIARRGLAQLRSGEPPTFLALGIQALLTLTIVTAFLPLAWDRYFLSIQSIASLLAATALGASSALLRRVRQPSRAAS